MTEKQILTALIKKVRDGDSEAMRQLVEKYGPEVKAVIRHTLNGNRLRRLIDPSDILQTVLLRLFIGREGEQSSVKDGHAFFFAMIKHRIADYARIHGGIKRDFKRQVGDAEAAGVADPSPSVSQVLILKEEMQRFLRFLSPSERKIAEERLAGATWRQIADSLGQYPDTIEKRFRRSLILAANSLRRDADT